MYSFYLFFFFYNCKKTFLILQNFNTFFNYLHFYKKYWNKIYYLKVNFFLFPRESYTKKSHFIKFSESNFNNNFYNFTLIFKKSNRNYIIKNLSNSISIFFKINFIFFFNYFLQNRINYLKHFNIFFFSMLSVFDFNPFFKNTTKNISLITSENVRFSRRINLVTFNINVI